MSADCEICHGATWLIDEHGDAQPCECRLAFDLAAMRLERRARDLMHARPEFGEPVPEFEGSHDPSEVLGEVFGHEEWRSSQQDVVDAILRGEDALVVLPTGGGKSLCFQLPAIVRQRQSLGVTVVVSPLVSLMRDQVRALRRKGVKAEALASDRDGRRARSRMLRGAATLVYVSPERAMSEEFLGDLAAMAFAGRLATLVVDEAHCVAHWGRDFRPSYLALGALRDLAPEVPCIALTATADDETRTEILRVLKMDAARVFIESFDRPNIRYRVVEKIDAAAQLPAMIRARHWNESGIVYCRRRDTVDQVAAELRANGIRALAFHAGVAKRDRQRRQETWRRDDAVVMVATVAFGMGIDRPDVRFVAHVDLPSSIEAYYQETGRAGRDSREAEAWLLFCADEVARVRGMLQRSVEDAATELDRFEALVDVVTTTGCRRQRLLAHFGESIDPCGRCDTCRQDEELISSPSQMPTKASDDGHVDEDLATDLRDLRTHLSAELGVPAIAVYSDRTLAAIARRRPRDLDELAAIKGISSKRLEAYGRRVLDVLADVA